MIGALGPDGAVRCSRAGCRADATARIEWRNPRIHPEGRVKVWLGCDEHREWLRDYLASREFPVRITGLEGSPA